MLIRYLPGGVPTVSALHVRENANLLRGKTVFLGVTALSAARDRLLNPYGQNVPGVEVHAHAFETMARGDFLQHSGDLAPLGLSILFATADLDLCCAAADQLLLLDAGRILQRGASRDVLDRPASLEAARLVGVPNLFQASVAALDPVRNSSRLEFEHFSLTGPYIPGHLKGDRVWVAAAAESLRLSSGSPLPPNSVALELVRASYRAHSVLLEFSFGIFVTVSHEEFVSRKDNKDWQVEFPPEALRVL